MENRVVGHFLDGRLVKGLSFDFSPLKAVCRIHTQTDSSVPVRLADLKALFLVKDLQGNPEYREGKTFEPNDPRRIGARPLEVQFRDGETMVGLAPAYSADRHFFFLLPADAKSNNTRVLVNRAAVVSVKESAAAGTTPGSTPAPGIAQN
jgi:hypothetical protein